VHVDVTRLVDAPIIGPELHPSIGVNIQGPSLIRVPDWVQDRLGRYYLYFADHKGSYIRLAYADALTGPWRVHPPGSLTLAQSGFPAETLAVSDAEVARFEAEHRARGVTLSNDMRSELTTPHIASPDVHVDHANRRIIMCYHGLEAPGRQVSRVALSADGIAFTARPEVIGPSYMRIFAHGGMTYALAMPGVLSRSADGLGGFETGPTLFNPNMRHAAVLKRDGALFVFWTEVGEAPERIKLSRIALAADWSAWRDEPAIEVVRPERPWEGADAPLLPSIRSTAYGRVNQLRDPAVYEEDGATYLLYAGGGESRIGLASVAFRSGAPTGHPAGIVSGAQ
jgi:hypothetical protein